MYPKIFVSGKPGSGKSTLVKEIVDELKKIGWRVGGIVTPEVRERKRRVGFKVVDVAKGNEAWLSSVYHKTDVSIGKYFVDVKSFENVAMPALEYALKECDLIVVDEIGKMELLSERFKQVIRKILTTQKCFLGVVHKAYVKDFQKYGKVYWIKRENWEKVKKKILEELVKNCYTYNRERNL